MAALSQQQFKVLIGHEVFELNNLPFLYELIQNLFVLYDHGKHLFDQIVIL